MEYKCSLCVRLGEIPVNNFNSSLNAVLGFTQQVLPIRIDW